MTIHTEQEGRGVDESLMDAVLAHCRQNGVRRIWLTTTNDSIRALRFHQRWGMDLAALMRDGVAASRRVKPWLRWSVPTVSRCGTSCSQTALGIAQLVASYTHADLSGTAAIRRLGVTLGGTLTGG